MPVSPNLAIPGLYFWNSYTLSFHHDSPLAVAGGQWVSKLPKLKESDIIQLHGQTVLITGANSGVGLETARKCVQFGAERIIFGVRNLAKGEEAKKAISVGANNEDIKTKIDVWYLDLENFESIVEFGKKVNEDFREEGKRLDYAILNAGIWNYRYYRATTGYEMRLQVNTLGSALLSLLLLPALSCASASSRNPARLAFSSSEAYAWADLKSGVHPDIFAHESEPERYKPFRGYYLSKLFLMFWSRELASRVDSSKVIVGDTTPGFCDTSIFDAQIHASWLGRFMMKLSHTAEIGANMYVLSIFLSKDKEFHDGYFKWGKLSKRSTYIRSKKGKHAQKEIWRQMMRILQDRVPDLDLAHLALSADAAANSTKA